ncbi:MAG: hypothetical protein J6A69_03420 [Clostridia bacterium]|nr:hypothetical protein [Clostridia bacterium]
MSIERIKTLILTLLILICITLGVQILFEEKLWSDDYDFFSVWSEKISSLFGNNENATNINVTGALDSIFSPRVAVLSYTDGRITVNFTDDESKELRNALNNVMKEALVKTDITATEQQWQAALTSKSVYADFSVPVSFEAMGEFLGIKNNITTLSYFDSMVIVTNNISNTSQVPVYFCDSTKGEYLNVSIFLNDNFLYDIQENYSKKEKQNISYAFEMNLDKKLDTNTHQKIIFDSYVRLNLDPINLNVLERENVDIYNENTVKKILQVLSLDYKASKKYTQSDSTTLYVDSDCVITFRPDGIIEYEATEGKGIKISEETTISSCAAGSAKLLDDLFGCFNISENTRIFVNSPLNEDETESYTFDFDYLYNSIPIYSENHGCSIDVKNGRITYLKAYIKNFTLASEGKESNPLEVIDILYETMGEKNIKINDLYFGYFDKNGQITLSWQAQIEGSDDIIIIN